MKQQKNTTTRGLGFIVAVILENADQSQTSNPDGAPKNPNDLREQKQSENPAENPDPELEDPNFVPEDDDAQSNGQESTQNTTNNSDLDTEDPVEFPDEDQDEIDQGEPQEELPIEENDDLTREEPVELPEQEDIDEVEIGDKDDLELE